MLTRSKSRGPVIDEPYPLGNGRFSCRYRYYDLHGKRIGRTVQGSTAREAKENATHDCRLAVEDVEAALLGRPTGPAPTFAEVMHDALLSTIPSRQKPKQVATTKRYLNGWWLPRIGHMPIDEVTPADLNRVIAEARQKVKDATCNRILAAAAVVFRHAEAANIIDRIPTTRATRMREGRVIPVLYSAAELTKVLDHLDAEWRLFIELMALAGLRKTEAIEARVGDIDLDNGQLIVRGGDEGTKSGHHRIVPILSTRLHTTLSAAINSGKKTKRRQLIEHVEPRNAIKRAAEKGGVDKIVSPHRLRHGFASLVHAGGVKQRGASVRTVQAWMGHSTLSVTERYTHLARPSAEGEALFDRLGQVVGRWGV